MSKDQSVLVEQAKTFIRADDSQIFGVIVAVIAVFITLVLFALWRRRKNARRGILVMGLCDSGKTLIFSHLLYKRYVMTHTSIKENIGDYLIKNDFLRIIDIPGHERLRGKFFDQYKSICRGVIFIIDSVTFQKEIRDVAEFLYVLLTDPVLAKSNTRFLIVCNKQDQTMAKGSNVIKSLLEKELNLLRVTKSHQLTSIEGSSNNVFLGMQNKDFEFSQCSPIVVEFAESSACNKDAVSELDSVFKWLSSI
ncbi:signal recognition particle receptor beta [Lycorma delicatula]|uniref:signal recognition particle receptor beta n=1 Tax=Lycorma delicatula TaxID=130591 RepID=UPI003F514D63